VIERIRAVDDEDIGIANRTIEGTHVLPDNNGDPAGSTFGRFFAILGREYL